MANNFKASTNNTSKAGESAISNSLKDAILFLNTTKVESGKFYSKRYFSTPERTKVDVILALGVLNGTGEKCYKIISESGHVVVWDVTTSIPDISQVILGQIYVYWDGENAQSYLIYLDENSRVVEKVSNPMIVFNAADKRHYYIAPDKIVDLYSQFEEGLYFEDRIAALEKTVEEILAGGVIPGPSTPAPDVPGDGEDDETTTTTTTPAPDVPGDGEDDETTTTTTTTTTTEPPTGGGEGEEDDENTTTTTTTTEPPVVPGTLRINSFTMDVPAECEIGDVVNPTFTWSYNMDIIEQSINHESIDILTRTKSFSGINRDTTFTLRASTGASTASDSKTIRFSPKTFSGGGKVKASAVTSENFYEVFGGMDSSYSNLECTGTVTRTFTFTEKSYLMFAYPSDKVTNLVITDPETNLTLIPNTNEVTVTNPYGETTTYTVFQTSSTFVAGSEVTLIFEF